MPLVWHETLVLHIFLALGLVSKLRHGRCGEQRCGEAYGSLGAGSERVFGSAGLGVVGALVEAARAEAGRAVRLQPDDGTLSRRSARTVVEGVTTGQQSAAECTLSSDLVRSGLHRDVSQCRS